MKHTPPTLKYHSGHNHHFPELEATRERLGTILIIQLMIGEIED